MQTSVLPPCLCANILSQIFGVSRAIVGITISTEAVGQRKNFSDDLQEAIEVVSTRVVLGKDEKGII